jgi:hypothetical protein
MWRSVLWFHAASSQEAKVTWTLLPQVGPFQEGFGRLAIGAWDGTGDSQFVFNQYLTAKDGAYWHDWPSKRLMRAFPWLILTLPAISPTPGGGDLKLNIPLTEVAGVGGRSRLLVNDQEIWKGDVDQGKSFTVEYTATMPYDDITLTIVAQSWEERGGTWEETARLEVTVPACFPKLSLSRVSFPAEAAAGRDFNYQLQAVNLGCAGKVRLSLNSQVVEERQVAAGAFLDLSRSLSMPYDDSRYTITASVLGRGKEWSTTSESSALVTARFPQLSAEASGPSRAMAGNDVEIGIRLINSGWPGDGGVVVEDTSRQEETRWEVPLEAGETRSLAFQGEMAPEEVWVLRIRPYWVGRGKKVVEGPIVELRVPASQTLFEYPDLVRFIGGETAFLVPGLLVAESVEFAQVEADDLVPPGQVRGAVPFTLKLTPGDIDEVRFSNMWLFRIEPERPMAVVRRRSLVSRGSRQYASGVLATPFNLARGLYAAGTRRRSKVAERSS